MYAGKLSTPLTTVVSRWELPLTLAHIIGDVKGTVLHDSTLMGQQPTARNSAASRSCLSSKQPPSLVGKERSFQEVSNATKNSKNGGRNQREMAIESDGEQ
ncbi:glutamate-1-semialdehyde 2,1-aminomutase, chloroplastic-like [Dorcoceras hygrometricum]|uniref:Glutamate-1-semialdehyde 2,1-aminomutase, chloroplastic-like n=1 Tax=Dorcoceras hygrometricum TaxID=472368 RepID=A0A2Z7A3Z5_9LAMI|nr:glutamate-1-semialdehyde 2,1-aminomutase, chloroplastic-like [Dorcoceras hygrometricum]